MFSLQDFCKSLPCIMYKADLCTASLVAETAKNLPAMQKTRVQVMAQEDPPEKAVQPTPVFLSGESLDRGAWAATVHEVTKNWT